MRDIMEVPFPLAASRRLINFLTFQISIYQPGLVSHCLSCCYVESSNAVVRRGSSYGGAAHNNTTRGWR